VFSNARTKQAVVFNFQNEREYVNKLVEVLEALMPEENRLRPSDKEFLIDLVMIKNRGVDIASKRSVQILTEDYGHASAGTVYQKRSLLKNKGWLKQSKDGYSLPGMFAYDPKQPDLKNFQIVLRYAPEQIAEGDSPAGGDVLVEQPTLTGTLDFET